MKIRSTIIDNSGLQVPAVEIAPPSPIGAAIIVHGYGGCKEEMLGLALHVAKLGLATLSIDLRGHGGNLQPFDTDVLEDLEVAIHQSRRFGKVVSIGHSLGGRLSLESSAGLQIGISPPLEATYSTRTQEMLEKLRGQRVRVDSPNTIFDLLGSMSSWKGGCDPRAMIIYGSEDIREIVASCDQLRGSMADLIMIKGARHNEIHLLQRTYEAVSERLERDFADTRTAIAINEKGANQRVLGHRTTASAQ